MLASVAGRRLPSPAVLCVLCPRVLFQLLLLLFGACHILTLPPFFLAFAFLFFWSRRWTAARQYASAAPHTWAPSASPHDWVTVVPERKGSLFLSTSISSLHSIFDWQGRPVRSMSSWRRAASQFAFRRGARNPFFLGQKKHAYRAIRYSCLAKLL